MTRRADAVDADVVSGDWRVRAAEAPRIPAAEALRALGLNVPGDVTLSVFVDPTDSAKGAALVIVVRPIPHEAVDVAKGTLLALWGRVGQALPFLRPFLAGGRR